jgi:eukaryotic-like serine/threonine-protein kinase
VSNVNKQQKTKDDCESLLIDLVVQCLDAKGAARRQLSQQFAADYPQFADALQEFFQGQSELDELIKPLVGLGHVQAETVSQLSGDSVDLSREFPALPDYENMELIARGGMGVVFKARHKGLDRIVAIKMIRSATIATDAEVRRFREEAQRVAQLDHPQIVPVYEIGNADGRPYFTMRLMEGGSLANRLANGELPAREAAQFVSQLAHAVHYAHQRGILHRDIKPGNILFDKNQSCQIADFGLAQRIDTETSDRKSVAIIGTPMYMAPEQARRAAALTTAVDVYGLGAVLYESLTGRPPFRADNPLDTLLEVIRREPTRPRHFKPNIDQDLETICLKCLEKEPDRRYGSAEALADDLERWLKNEPIVARRTSYYRRVLKWIKRSPAIAALASLSVVAIAICIAALIISYSEISREAKQKSLALQERTQALSERTEALDRLQALRDRERHLAYFQTISLAERELVAGNIARVEQILGECPVEMRAWEWRYLSQQCHAELHSHSVLDEPACIRCVSGNDRIYVAGGILGKPGWISLHDPALPDASRVIRIHKDAVAALAFSADGLKMASASGRSVKVSSSENGIVALELPAQQGAVCSLAFSPDGGRLATVGTDRNVRIWDVATGREMLSFVGHTETIWWISFSPDGQTIATSSADRSVKLWNAKTGECLHRLTGHLATVRSVEFSPDGQQLVSAGYDNTARVWNAVTGTELVVLKGHMGLVTRACFSPDNQRIATSSSDGTLRIWDAESGATTLLLRGHFGAVWDVVWQHDGRQVVSVGSDGTFKIWEGTQHGMPKAFGNRDGLIHSLKLNADGTRLAMVYGDQALEIWNATNDQKLCRIRGTFNLKDQLEFSGDGRVLAVALSEVIEIRNTDDGKISHKIPVPNPLLKPMALNKDGRLLAAQDADQSIHVWDTSHHERICKLTPPAKAISLALSPDGRMLVAICDDESRPSKQGVIWKTEGGAEFVRFATDGSRVSFSNDGKSFACFGNGSVVSVWDLNTATLKVSVDRHRSRVHAVAFTVDGDRMFMADDEGVVTVWDTTTGHEVLALREMMVPIHFVGLPEGKSLLGIGGSGAARRWFAGRISD